MGILNYDDDDLAYDSDGNVIGFVQSWRLTNRGMIPVIIPISGVVKQIKGIEDGTIKTHPIDTLWDDTSN